MNIVFLLFLLIFSFVTSSSAAVFYPPLHRLIEYLSTNSTLPHCYSNNCKQTETQANFPSSNFTDEDLFKLSSYDRTYRSVASFRRPFLIASTGIYRGKRLRYQNRYVDQFLGIFYAETPQPLHKPVKKIFQYSIENATTFTPCCMQSTTMAANLSYGSFFMRNHFEENCLSLNIYRADLRLGEKRKAIMLFSHGGSNQLGSGSLFDGSILASEGDLIVITMNFRLNYHGFLSSGDERIRGNYGLWDQLLAVEWIYENAHLFGGDPKRIVLAGHSAGAGNVMLIPASPHCHGMVRRVISQSGTGLAPWSINRQPMKLLERFAEEFNCSKANNEILVECILKLLRKNSEEIYRLHLSLSISDDNPYPVIDNDFLNDTMENLLGGDRFANIDILTGVTLNEGLYFAEYHVKHLYNIILAQQQQQKSLAKQKRSHPIDDDWTVKFRRDTNFEQFFNFDSTQILDQFAAINYVDRYVEANFHNSRCLINDIKERYELPGKDNITHRLQLYIDLVSDLMFNFHMVECLNLRATASKSNSSTYAYIYSHRPSLKVRSTLRDQLKILPNAVGHFAELDYIFGVPLIRNNTRFHRNVNMSYNNYTTDEENFSREIIRYWSNFIKTGDPNRSPTSSAEFTSVQWPPYTKDEHNYFYFHLNNLHNERNYFDSMYQFWLDRFEIENLTSCDQLPSPTKPPRKFAYFRTLLIAFALLAIVPLSYILGKYFQQKRKKGRLLTSHSATLLSYPQHVSA